MRAARLLVLGLVALATMTGVASALQPPRIGTMAGMAGTSQVQLTFDRHEWTIGGTFDQLPVALEIDHGGATISGNAHGCAVNLTFDWSPDRVIYGGTTCGQPVAATLDWRAGTLTGHVGSDDVSFRFDLAAGTVTGQVGVEETQLSYEPVSGLLRGTFAGRSLRLKLVNLDVSDFLQHFYLFLD